MDISPLEALIELLRRGVFDYSDEKVCQDQIEVYLNASKVEFIREYKLANGIIDFFFPRSGTGLEVKASKNWSKTQVFRQCERYCYNDEIKALLLATGKAQGLPDVINEKPVRIFQLGVSLL